MQLKDCANHTNVFIWGTVDHTWIYTHYWQMLKDRADTASVRTPATIDTNGNITLRYSDSPRYAREDFETYYVDDMFPRLKRCEK